MGVRRGSIIKYLMSGAILAVIVFGGLCAAFIHWERFDARAKTAMVPGVLLEELPATIRAQINDKTDDPSLRAYVLDAFAWECTGTLTLHIYEGKRTSMVLYMLCEREGQRNVIRCVRAE